MGMYDPFEGCVPWGTTGLQCPDQEGVPCPSDLWCSSTTTMCSMYTDAADKATCLAYPTKWGCPDYSSQVSSANELIAVKYFPSRHPYMVGGSSDPYAPKCVCTAPGVPYCARTCTGGCYLSLATQREVNAAEIGIPVSDWLTYIANGSIDPITNRWKLDEHGCPLVSQKWCDMLGKCIDSTATCPQKDANGCIIGQQTWCATQVAGIPQEGCIPIGNTCPPARDNRGCLVDSETWCSVKLSCIPKADLCGLPPAVDEHGCLTDTQKWCNTSSICIGINDTCYIYEPSRDENGCLIGPEEWCDTLEMCLVAGSSCPSPPPPTVIDEKGCIVGQQKYCDTNSQCIGINDTCPIYEPERDEHGCVVGQQKWCDDVGKCIGVEDACVVPPLATTTAGLNPLLILGVIGIVAVGAMAFGGKKNGKAAP